MKPIIAAVFAATLLAASPALAAGCIKGALVGSLAAKATHHSVLLGALGGCIVGHVLANPHGVSYGDVTGRMLGADADLRQAGSASSVNIVKLSTLKGYPKGGADAGLASNAKVQKLDAEVGQNASLAAMLKASGFSPSDVVAVSGGKTPTLYVNA